MDAEAAPPRFSVVIPALNEEAAIRACLESLAAQDFAGSVEVIVVDNNSTDATPQIARALGARVVSEHRPGVVWARQAGVEAATGEYVITTDADTTFVPTWLATIDEACRQRPDATLVAGPCAYQKGPAWAPAISNLTFGFVNLRLRLTGRLVYVSATNLCFPRHAFDGYDTTLTQGGDEVAVLYAQRRKGAVVWLPKNATLTSSRRLERGLVYTLLVSFGYYYLLGYYLNRLTGRRIMGMAPPIRPDATHHEHGTVRDAAAGAGALGAFAGVVALRRSVGRRR